MTVTWRAMTPAQLEAKRACQAAWYQANRDRLRIRDRDRQAAQRRNRRTAAQDAARRGEIECAIARGLTIQQIVDRLGVTVDAVHAAWDYLDEVAAS